MQAAGKFNFMNFLLRFTMNKYIVILLLGVVTAVLAESSLKRDKDTLIKGRRNIFHV